MRNLGSALGLVAALWSVIQAPFDHIHPEDHDGHPTSAACCHFHPGAPVSAHPYLDAAAADDDEIDVVWSVTSPDSPNGASAPMIVRALAFPPPARVAGAVFAPENHAHDPPTPVRLIPRAPPAA